MAPFDSQSFEDDVASLQSFINAGHTIRDNLHKTTRLLEDQDSMVNESLDRMTSELAHMSRAIERLCEHLEAQGEQQTRTMLKAMKQLFDRDRQAAPTAPVLGKSANTVGTVLLAKAAEVAFGPKGGKVMQYNKDLAVRLLQKNMLTSQEHRMWKKTHRLPDHVDVAHSTGERHTLQRPA